MDETEGPNSNAVRAGVMTLPTFVRNARAMPAETVRLTWLRSNGLDRRG
jgi:hypothetical protein